MPLPKLSLEKLKRAATEKSFSRGEDYFRSGAVLNPTLRQQVLHAEVEGNTVDPYRVTVTFDGGGVTQATCSCPYSFEGWCKHIVATLLVCIREPDTVEERPPLAELLDQLSPSQTRAMIESLVAEDSSLLEPIDFYVSCIASAEKATVAKSSEKRSYPKRKTKVNPKPYEYQVQEIFRTAVRGWEYGDDDDSISYDLAELMQDAIAFSEKGDGDSALVVLAGITEACARYWYIVDDFIGMGPDEFNIDFDSTWTEVLLSIELSEGEITHWQEQLEVWQDSLGSLDMALEALRQGWDYAPLQKVFVGEITEKGAWLGEAPDWADEFSQIRLKLLKRDERYEDYLLLAQAEGLTQEYLTMLGQLGRTDEAMEAAQEQLGTLSEAIALAKTLREQEQLSQALEIAIKGLRLDPEDSYRMFEFASWTQDLAEGLGDKEVALEAGIFAFRAKPSLKGYQDIEGFSGDEWLAVKAELLQQIRQMNAWQGVDEQIDILLHENLIDDAIAKVSGFSSYRENLSLRVMDRAIASHSQWVIDTAIPKAQAIADEGKSKYYSSAVEWLKRVKAAYAALGQVQDWQRYKKELVDTHGRKRKLMELMRQAGL
ncbi:MAG: SWIM zinc finger family protein [Cyanobacteria bacterium P01_F01_bin.3]